MSMLVSGQWRPDVSKLTTEDGEFERDQTTFRDRIRDDPDAEFPADAGRYHLYVARPCPWAHGTALVRALYGLQDAISMDVVDPYRQDDGWAFSPERDDCTPDTVNGSDYLREVYVEADPDYTGRVSVPVLWDTERDTIVNNESIEIMRMLATEFGDLAERDLDLYPEGRRDQVDSVVSDLYESVNNGVYRAGFARTQSAYDDAVTALFSALDRWEGVLRDQRYLLGEDLTLSDLRLFATLLRFDPVYHGHFKCNVRRVRDYPNLWNHTKEIYQLPGVTATVNLDHIKEHYYRSHDHINPTGIVPAGPAIDFAEPHDRERLPGGPPEALR